MAASSNTILNSTFSEKNWLHQTRKIIENKTPEDHNNIPISVCQVPNSISVVNPQAYAPQVIALGPYHYLRPELYHMGRFKIEMVKSFWEIEQINLVVKRLESIGPNIRACYHKYLDLNDETLALMLAIDGLFLIYLLSKDLNQFTDNSFVFSDVMMLENQIPTILLKEIVNTISLSKRDDDKLFSMMRVFCESQSPFELQSNQSNLQETKALHLLDLLHKMITVTDNKATEMLAGETIRQPPSTPVQVQLSVTMNINPDNDLLIDNLGGILATEILSSIKPIQLMTTLPWGMISNFLSYSSGLKEVATNNPLVEEIQIPSVSQLSKLAGIGFKPQDGGTLKTQFDNLTGTLYLPVITLTGNSEVILRNLEAYEIASSSKTLLAEYLDLMSGIIDTKDDVSLLRVAGIIKGDLKNSQIADLFNGMNKSSRKFYDYDTATVINEYCRHKMKMKTYKFAKEYVYKSWKFLTVVSTLVLLLLLIFQSFCNVYDCSRILH